MKKSRLLEIIREEISGALGEASYAGKGSIPQMKKDPKYSTLSQDGKMNAEKELKSGGTVELEEDNLNEIPDFGGRYDQQVAAKYGEDQTLQDATNDIVDEVLSDMGVTKEDLKKDEEKAKEVLKAIRSKVVGKNQDPRVKKALEKQEEFDDSGNVLQANQTNNAILKALGLREPGQRGRKADPNKPEKAPSTGKRGRPAGTGGETKTATLTPGDDGFDDVSYSEPKKSEESPKISSKLEKIADNRDALIKLQRQTTDKMKELAQKRKEASEEEASKIMDELKKLNKIKAEVDKKLDDLGF